MYQQKTYQNYNHPNHHDDPYNQWDNCKRKQFRNTNTLYQLRFLIAYSSNIRRQGTFKHVNHILNNVHAIIHYFINAMNIWFKIIIIPSIFGLHFIGKFFQDIIKSHSMAIIIFITFMIWVFYGS